MIVTFISQCQKNSLKITRQILDAYANRIGERTWQTVITQEGLNAVKSRLAKTARKTTAVACHRMHGTSRTELVWVVGNKREFDFAGNVPVNRTQRDLLKEHLENDWQYLQMIKTLVALSALFHDFGKSWDYFQIMLKDNKKRDPIRHEWVSVLLFRAFVLGKTDEQWLSELAALGSADAKTRKAASQRLIKSPVPTQKNVLKPLHGLSPFSAWVAWLIVSHHRLPELNESDFGNGDEVVTPKQIFRSISLQQAGYLKGALKESELKWKFSNDLPLISEKWCKEAAKQAEKAKQCLALFSTEQLQAIERSNLTLARLCLMLGDHHYSAAKAEKGWNELELFANTDKADASGIRPLKQRLDEHLFNVSKEALKVAHLLPAIEEKLARVGKIRALRKPSPPDYHWQNKAVNEISQWKKDHDLSKGGFFAINMASTGTGKTFANAKVMYALSDDESLRYNLALGLRTLTLQTGDEYREKIFQHRAEGETELAVLIGSAAVQYLHEQKREQAQDEVVAEGSESAQLIDDFFEVSSGNIGDDSVLETLFSCRGEDAYKRNQKKRRFLDTPIVVSTIDHLMPATEGVWGGKQILPTLRLMSADLVIDEVDDFNEQDYPAICRLVHLVGMLGRKLMISSATIPPAIAQGLYQAYQAGWSIFSASCKRSATITVLWLDEFQAKPYALSSTQEFSIKHTNFVNERLKNLAKLPPKRKAQILPIEPANAKLDKSQAQTEYFAKLFDAALALHRNHALDEPTTGKQFSVGVIRLANVEPCIGMTRYLLSCAVPDDIEIRVIAYHARQVLLLRSRIEAHVELMLKRKTEQKLLSNIIPHLQSTSKKQVVFIVVASPVEEVGRDHDFDWAVIEPSSMRSIIQMAGRVLRHREKAINTPNISLPEYNLKGYLQPESIVFMHPGFESKEHPLIGKHSLQTLLDTKTLAKKLDASARIQPNQPLQPTTRLDDLEHQVLNDLLLNQDHRPEQVWGWLEGSYYLTGLAQRITPFRKQSMSESSYKLHLTENDAFEIRSPDGKGLGKRHQHITLQALDKSSQQRLWLTLDYVAAIEEEVASSGKSRQQICEFLGEFALPDNEGEQSFVFTPELGFEKCKA
ncbi:type I-F CRISPR-associated helicase Cas3f [Thiolinea disciformis]|uniref:type I-F CRISPR-associated helicase Cas3f n=1 Tax=Thiolinea disciformis TaxID=125614 RepID=UPI00035ED807|nr:type I-F CRISPR-associated helicase Cas3f [Thiolinea disciformis]